MRLLLLLLAATASFAVHAQQEEKFVTAKDSLLVIPKDIAKGFHHDYLLFIPKGTPLKKKTFLLVEPNNTGKLSDSMEVHKRHAIFLASVSSVGNNISTELKIPLLVPVFPRLASKPNTYTHALDRDAMLERTPALRRLDLQLVQMITDAMTVLRSLNIAVDEKVFMNGFSASATFTNRFSFLHPGRIKALAMGGFNGELMFPQSSIHGVSLNYPIGTNDFSKLFGDTVHLTAYRQVPQYIYMGRLDENDAVQFDDAYSRKERKIINENIGTGVQQRYVACQKVYRDNGVNAIFKTYEEVGHWTTGAVNLDVIKFFWSQMKEQ